MERTSKLFIAKFNTFFFSWGFYYFSAGYFCYQLNRDDRLCMTIS